MISQCVDVCAQFYMLHATCYMLHATCYMLQINKNVYLMKDESLKNYFLNYIHTLVATPFLLKFIRHEFIDRID